MAAPAPAPALLDEIIEEFLLRLPPSEPETLVHAALVCKPWYRIISDPRFRRRFREFHRSAPMLGFFCNLSGAQFVPTSSFHPPDAGNSRALDARHGRVLLSPSEDLDGRLLVVWDPTTDQRWEVPPVPLPDFWGEEMDYWSSTVLCAAAASSTCDCNHHDCHGRPFIVVYVGRIIHPKLMSLQVYSSEAYSWSQLTWVLDCSVDDEVLSALVGSTLYFPIDYSTRALSYDLATREVSVIHLPPKPRHYASATAFMEMENGGLGVARLDEDAKLSLLSMEVNSNGDMGWAQIKVIELDKVLPINARSICSAFLGFAQGVGVFFIGTYDGLFSFDSKSGRVSKVFDKPCDDLGYLGDLAPCVVPYESFYTPSPGLGSTTKDEEPGVDATSV